ncbi:SDR family NAD(P)-dependent oxidoreductase [Hydrocarboniphaga sp.]|uniref:SDR family NAD(P)-dependent oxidoreductase n=1 Tax=Hydrocarboniphaga sp. TaxID=2033016 RepID=UPI003D11EDC6
MRLKDKIALVTGAASGIGEAIARRFAQEGATVYVADVAQAAGERVAAEVGGHFLQLDVTVEADWSAAMQHIADRHQRLDALVNNAAIISNASIDSIDLQSWNRVLAVNLTGPMLGCRAAIAMMRRNATPGGSIVNLGSTTSFLGLPNDVIYTTTKTGVLGLTRSAAVQCARQGWNIRINSLHPGTTDTAILQGHIAQDPSMLGRFNAMSPMGRMAQPREIAALALFLVSDEASYCTGGAYTADGGLGATHPGM